MDITPIRKVPMVTAGRGRLAFGRRRAASWLLAIAIVAGGTLAVATPAQARGWMGRTGYEYGGHTLGTLKPPGYDEQVVCIDTDSDLPSKKTSPSTSSKPRVAYLMTKYGQTTSDSKAAALAWIVKREMNDPGFSYARAVLDHQSSSVQNTVKDLIQSMWAESDDYSGKYTMLKPNADIPNPATAPLDGVVSNVGIKASSGLLMSGVTITLRLSGPAYFNANGTRTLVLTSGSAAKSTAFTVTGTTDPIDVSATSAKTLANTTVKVHPRPSGTHEQRVVTTSGLVSVFAEDPTSPLVQITPTLTSEVTGGYRTDNTQIVGPDAGHITETLRMSAQGLRGVPISVHTTLYGPIAQRPTKELAEVPDGIDEVRTFTGTMIPDEVGQAHASWTINDFPFTESGWYVFVEGNDEDLDNGVAASEGTFGRASEMFYVTVPGELHTTAQATTSRPGAEISDTIEVKGVDPNAPAGLVVEVGGGALGPVDAVDHDCAKADWTDAKTATIIEPFAVDHDGLYEHIGVFSATKAACYTYGESMVATVDDVTLWVYEHPVGVTTQTVLLQSVQPSLTSQAASGGVTTTSAMPVVGSKQTVTETLTMNAPRAEGIDIHVHTTLYGPIAQRPTKELAKVPDGVAKVLTLTGTMTPDKDGAAEITLTADHAFTKPGWYVFVEGNDADPANGITATTGTFGRSSEMFYIGDGGGGDSGGGGGGGNGIDSGVAAVVPRSALGALTGTGLVLLASAMLWVRGRQRGTRR